MTWLLIYIFAEFQMSFGCSFLGENGTKSLWQNESVVFCIVHFILKDIQALYKFCISTNATISGVERSGRLFGHSNSMV